MKVISTNIGHKRTVIWNREEVTTGIFKNPVDEPIFLDSESVQEDHIADLRYHGGVDKACYIYSADHYPKWQALYPYLEWDYGMFGENLTIQGFDESKAQVGEIYQLGKTIVQITEPRQPCVKLNIRFNSKDMVKQFVNFELPGAYLRVLEPGYVENGDSFKRIQKAENEITLQDIYCAIYKRRNHDISLVKKMIEIPELANDTREKLMHVWKL